LSKGIPGAWDEFITETAAGTEKAVMQRMAKFITDPTQEHESSKWQTLLVQPLWF